MTDTPETASDRGNPTDDIRPGEVAIALPAAFDAGLFFIGRIHTPWTRREDCPKNARESDAVCTIDVDERYAAALLGVESCTHLLVLYWMHQARRDLVLQAPRHYWQQRGTFALRSPVSNPIAASVAKLVGIHGARLSVVGLDCLDGTPLLDIKPYFASTDAVADGGRLACRAQALIRGARVDKGLHGICSNRDEKPAPD